jgi:hypothetical protein
LAGAIRFSSNQQNILIPNAQLNNSGTYFVTVSTSSGCTAAVTTNFIVVEDYPQVNISTNSPVCSGTPINFIASEGLNYQWQGPVNFTSQSSSIVINNASIANAGISDITVFNGGVCSAVESVEIIVNQTPNAYISIADNILFAYPENPEYQWIDCFIQENIIGATQQIFTPNAIANYAVIITLNICSDLSDCVVVTDINSEVLTNVFIYPNHKVP